MKGQGKWKKSVKRKKDNGKLQKYMMSVDEFVQSKCGCDEEGNDDEGLRFVKKKSRKELRKEKRKMKKAKMKSYYEGKNSLSLPIGDGEDSGITADKPQQQGKKVKEEAKKEASKSPQTKSTHAATETSEKSKKQLISKKGKKINRLQESRKKALLEANQAEDREIKKLERYLGLNKRKNKKNLPQSFAADGLDYILGVLDSGSSAAGMYDSDDDMDMAKEKFKRLDGSDSEMSGEEKEEDESGNEGSENDSDEDLDSMDKDNEDDDEMTDEEEEEMEEDEDKLDESDVADSDNESEGEAERDNHSTKTSGTKTGTVSSEI